MSYNYRLCRNLLVYCIVLIVPMPQTLQDFCLGSTRSQDTPIVTLSTVLAATDLTPQQKILGNSLLSTIDSSVGQAFTKASEILSLVVRFMRIVETYNLHGEDKKRVVLYIIARLINNLDMSDEDKESLFLIAYPLVSTSIDTIVMAVNGGLDELRASCISWCRRRLALPPLPPSTDA